MTTPEILRLLTEQEHLVAKQRNTALARGNWTKAIECDAVERFSQHVRSLIAADPKNDPVIEQAK